MRRRLVVLGTALVVLLLAVAPVSAKGGAGRPSGSKRIQPVPTKLVHPVYTGTAVSVRLTRTDTGGGINGERVTFTFPTRVPQPAPGAGTCTATTKSAPPPHEPTNLASEDGWATCALGLPDAVVAAPSQLTATYAGTSVYGPSQVWVSGYLCTPDGFCVYDT